jgi:hypothetical protein
MNDLKELYRIARKEPDGSDFFKNRGSKKEYIKMLKHKMKRQMQNENGIPTFKQYHEQKCWDGYKPDPKKKTKYSPSKGKRKRVNNCVSEKNAQCTGPTKKASSTSKGKKWMKCVKSDSGGYKRIHWGQKGVKVSGKANTKRRKSFRARHKCSSAKSNTPRGQACKDW